MRKGKVKILKNTFKILIESDTTGMSLTKFSSGFLKLPISESQRFYVQESEVRSSNLPSVSFLAIRDYLFFFFSRNLCLSRGICCAAVKRACVSHW